MADNPDRKQLLDRLRHELTTRDWEALRPDERLADLDGELTEMVERLEAIVSSFYDDSERDVFGALDDLSAALSYFRADIGRLFSDATRLNNELRAELDRSESDEGGGVAEATIELPGINQAAKEARVDSATEAPHDASREAPAEDSEPESPQLELLS